MTASTSDADSLEVKLYLSCFENATLLVSEAVIAAAAAAASQVSGHETADTLLADFAQKCSAGLEVKYLSCFENATLLVSDLDSVADEAVIAAAAAAQESGHVTADTLLDDFAQQCSYGLEVKCLSWFENAILLGVDLHSVADEAVIAVAVAAAAQVSGHVWAHTLLAGFA